MKSTCSGLTSPLIKRMLEGGPGVRGESQPCCLWQNLSKKPKREALQGQKERFTRVDRGANQQLVVEQRKTGRSSIGGGGRVVGAR